MGANDKLAYTVQLLALRCCHVRCAVDLLPRTCAVTYDKEQGWGREDIAIYIIITVRRLASYIRYVFFCEAGAEASATLRTPATLRRY